jgi:cytochrome c oxidase subunit III
MWLFLLTEIMFFGGLFTAYLIYAQLVLPGVCRGLAPVEHLLGHANTRCSSVQLHHGHGRVVGGDAAQGRLVLCLSSPSFSAWPFWASRPSSTHEKWEKHHVPGFHYSVQSFLNPASDPEVYKEYHDKPLAPDMAQKTESISSSTSP